jgi:hypothetical protein
VHLLVKKLCSHFLLKHTCVKLYQIGCLSFMSLASCASSMPLNLGSHMKEIYVYDHAAEVWIQFLSTGILVFMYLYHDCQSWSSILYHSIKPSLICNTEFYLCVNRQAGFATLMWGWTNFIKLSLLLLLFS